MAKNDTCCEQFMNFGGKDEKTKLLRMLELYSGIGGMHFALQKACIPHAIIGAYDINTVANDIYKFNFPHSNHCQRNIHSLTVQELDDMKADLLTMSPPCQPFTRVGLKQDCLDNRTSSFLHIIQLMKHVQHGPTYILLENVKGFETSEARRMLLEVLNECGYVFQEFLLSPVQFGIPNSRLRYYLLAKKSPFQFCFKPSDDIFREFVDVPSSLDDKKCDILQNYLECDRCTDPYLISDRILLKYAMVFDIVDASSSNCCCFTKAYGHYFQGTGSILRQNCDVSMSEIFQKTLDKNLEETEKLELLKKLRLRYFTPTEVANLMCFPQHFKFPLTVTRKQQYRVLGNSVNVGVISELLKLLLNNESYVES
ncbi:tRNA (cytosine(38)-C(5))-methyltransferase-like [Centruroides sculpturatus]|uniref:tRNA (cytosine(38)-C(5))-methyltransferase-like n=1 Tax=Centruroides sculpturatus TaxID=218467 RepID=UPI000C6D67FB|nr:tRNA (cytosine(38)-C(5))-methyltransferase-like [Centruroides sculpturatus]